MTHIELFTSDRLATGNYTMSITTDGVRQGGPTFYLLIPDSVSVPLEKVIVDDEDSAWRFTGEWERVNRPGNYLDTVHRNRNAGGNATFEFEGTEITMYGTLVGLYSDVKPLGFVQIDDGTNHTVMASDIPNETTLNDGSAMRGQKIFATSGLPQGQHTLTVVIPWNPVTPSTVATPSNPPWFIDCAVHGPVAAADQVPIGSNTPAAAASPPVGAIAGGVISGVVVLGALIAAFILWRRKRRHSNLDAKTAAPEEFLLDTPAPTITPYQTSTTPSSSAALLGRSTSMHKPLAEANVNRTYEQANGPEGSLLGGSTATGSLSPRGRNRQAGTSRTTGSDTGTGSVTEATTVSTDPSAVRPNNRRRGREQDGGVRLASGSDDGDDFAEDEDVLPPKYARY